MKLLTQNELQFLEQIKNKYYCNNVKDLLNWLKKEFELMIKINSEFNNNKEYSNECFKYITSKLLK